MRWKRCLTKVPNIAGRAEEKITAVATMPVPTNSTYGSPSDVVDQGRAQPEPEGQQVDHRLERAGEDSRLPEGPEVGELPAHDRPDRHRFESPADPLHSASSPVSSTNTSSSELARLTAPSGTCQLFERSIPTTAIAGPAGLTESPAASAERRISISFSGEA